jgi:hypothetical protein
MPRIGTERSNRQYQIGSLLRAGAHVSFGSDWPCSDHRPLAGLPVAVTRQTTSQEPADGWISDERITFEDALRAYTSGVVYQAFAEVERGTLTSGKVADLVWSTATCSGWTTRTKSAMRPYGGTWLSGTRIFTPHTPEILKRVVR